MAILSSSWSTDLLSLFAGVLIILYFYLTKTYDYWKKRNLPYEKPRLILGNFYDALTFKNNISTFFEKQYRKTKEPFFGLYIFQRPYLLIRDPDLIKYVLVKHFDNFIIKSNMESEKDVLGRYNMFSMKDVHSWRFVRSKITPFFTTGKMRNTFSLLNEIGEQLTEHMKKHVSQSIDMKDVSRKYTTDVIVSAAYGIQANSFVNKDAEFFAIGTEIFNYTIRRSLELLCFFFAPIMVRIFNFVFFDEKTTQFLRRMVWSVVKVREENNIKRPDLIDALITLKNKGTLEENIGNGVSSIEKHSTEDKPPIKLDGDVLVAQAAVFFTAGSETSSLTISFTLYSLSYNPEIQIKLRKEIQSVIAENGGNFTYDCLAKMKYLDLCIKETLRLYPTLGFLDRESMSEYTFPGTNVTIDKGTAVIISLQGLHMDPEYFENPTVYDPERFNDENKSKISSYTYMPFGEGPRNCIGARFGVTAAKIGLVHILKDFQVVTSKTPPPLEVDSKAFFLSPKHGIHLTFEPGTIYTE